MRYNVCHLPNGQSFTVSPVFGGFNFKSNDLNQGNSILPPGWNIVLCTRQQTDKGPDGELRNEERGRAQHADRKDAARLRVTRFTDPTLSADEIYISYIVNPPDSNYKPATSPTRQIAMMLWVTLAWYFQEPEPDLHLYTDASSSTPVAGKPKGDWRINIKREGVFTGRNVLPKLERMGLVTSEDSSVGCDVDSEDSWSHMFVSRRSFWQLDPRLYLFTLSPQSAQHTSPFVRVASPTRETLYLREAKGRPPTPEPGHFTPSEGPFALHSHLPSFFPPSPPQFTFTNGVRHPIRQKPPHQGEAFYVRYIPSLGQYLSFRVASLPCQKDMPNGPFPARQFSPAVNMDEPASSTPSDLEYLHKWMNEPRVNLAWGEAGPISRQEAFLRQNLSKRHSFPVIGCWDGQPFGYFEIYWVKEDPLGSLIGGVDNYDRGIHVLVGEQEFRGPHRVSVWLSSLVHYCWLADMRTQTVMLEPRVDNEKIINYLQEAGFYKDGEVTFPHKHVTSLPQEQRFSDRNLDKRDSSLNPPLDEPLLAVQIGGIVGAYVIFVAIIITLLLVVGRRLRRTVQSSNYTLQVEMMKPKAPIATMTAASTTDPSPVTPTNKLQGFKSWTSLSRGHHTRGTSNNGSVATLDHESVVAADRRKAQEDMEMLYAAVMEHEERRAAAATSPVSPTEEVDLQDLSPRSPASYQNAHTNPFADYATGIPEPYPQQPPQQPKKVTVAPPAPASPRSTSSRLSRLSSLSLFNSNANSTAQHQNKLRSPRLPLRKLPISSPMRSPDPASPNSDQVPLSPRLYNPPPPPAPPTTRATNNTSQERPRPTPAPLNLQAAAPSAGRSSSSLPFREAYPQLLSAPPTKTTILERPEKQLNGPRTGLPTPYSPYMPFTPLTPLTPSRIVTKKQRKREGRENGLRALNEEDAVRDDSDMWGY
ncbi:hypothetical protein BJX61DRAFT_534718 [Aspergillus egyptiacus]|nr:hypothetical protein BJX61DRAFT_534718 [Aspergillus egyptiacus]